VAPVAAAAAAERATAMRKNSSSSSSSPLIRPATMSVEDHGIDLTIIMLGGQHVSEEAQSREMQPARPQCTSYS